MREAFVKKLMELAGKDKSVYLITADTGFNVLDEFKKVFPDRFLNVGISEASMIGIASGLALCGKKVFLYAIVPFITMRCFEQIRVDLCYQNLPVKLIGVGQGLTYGTAGATHHSIEDIGLMNCLPNMTVICPGDPLEVEKAVESSMCLGGPCYIRLGKSGEKVIHPPPLKSFVIGKGIRIQKGKDIALIATGNMLETAKDVYELLVQKGFHPELISMHTIKPLDERLIIETAARCKLMVTVEEHSRIGGLGYNVANVMVENNLKAKLIKIALPDKFVDVVGCQEDLREYFGLTVERITEAILRS